MTAGEHPSAAVGDDSLLARVEAVETAAALGRGRLADHLVDAAAAVVDKARARLRHGTGHTVVALAGPTGVGKSSLFNAIVGETVSDPGVRRPTTGTAHAAIWGDGNPPLLDWLGVGYRHHVIADARQFEGLILIDLPDFDSTERTHRLEVDRVLELVDVIVWVTDPQKYADEVFHDEYVRPFAEHADVMDFVLNRVDMVAAADVATVVADLARRLDDDGVSDAAVIATSVATGAGVDRVDDMLTDAVERKRAMTERLESDIRAVAKAMLTGDEALTLSRSERRRFVERLAEAAGAGSAGSIVAAQHRHDARASMGWPPGKLLTRWRRRHPIADLPRASVSAVAGSEIDLALRDVAEAASQGAAAPWPRVIRSTAAAHAMDLRHELTTVTDAAARHAVGRPKWWVAIAALQRMLAVAALVGAVWLLVVAVLGGFLQLDTDPLLIDTPGVDWVPLPSLLVIGGLALGLVVALIVRIPVGVAARRRGRSVRRDLVRRVGQTADRTVLADIDRVLDDRRELERLLRLAAAD